MISATGRNKGFSLIELMVTVVIVSVSLIFILRAYGFCASRITNAHNRMQGVLILGDLLRDLKEKELTDEDMGNGSENGEIEINGKFFKWTKEISEWQAPADGFFGNLAPSEDMPGGESVSSGEGIAYVQLGVSWKAAGVGKETKLRTIMIRKNGI